MMLAVLWILLIVFLYAISANIPDDKPEIIRRELTNQGCEVAHIEFSYVMPGEGYREWIYEASQPVYFDGAYHSLWSLTRVSVASPAFGTYCLRPDSAAQGRGSPPPAVFVLWYNVL